MQPFEQRLLVSPCSSSHITAETVLVKSNLFGIFSAVSKCFMTAMFRTLTESVRAKRLRVLKPPYTRYQSSLCIFLRSLYDLNFSSRTEQAASGATTDWTQLAILIRHLRHPRGDNPPGAKCAARPEPAALKCRWVDADWWGGGLKGCGEKGRRWLRGG